MTSPDKSRMTTTMDTKRLNEPVIFEIPERGRLMSSHKIAAEIRAGLKGDKGVCAQTFHEGYIGDKRYLVPDSTLKAMADIIHFKVRHVEDTKNMELFDPNDEQAGLRRWQKKHGSIMHKLDDITLAEYNEDQNDKGDRKGEEEDAREQESNWRDTDSEDDSEEENEVKGDIADDVSESEDINESQEEEEYEEAEEIEEESNSEEEEAEAGEEESQSEEVDGGNEAQEEEEYEESGEIDEESDSEEEGAEAEEEKSQPEEVEGGNESQEEEENKEEVEEDENSHKEEGEEKQDESEEDDEKYSYMVQHNEDEGNEGLNAEGVKAMLEEDKTNTLVTLFRGQGVSYETSEVCKDSSVGEIEEPVAGKGRKSLEGGESEIEEEQDSYQPEEDNNKSEPIQTVKEERDRIKNEEQDNGLDVTRFLISGHIRSNRKPIYIVQKYHGPSPFHNKDPDFFSHKSEQHVDVFMRGQFFRESILEEDRYLQPVSLKTSPRKVDIDSMSKVFEEKFTHVFVGTVVDLQISGSYVENSPKALYTPLISIILRKGTELETHVAPGNPVKLMRPKVGLFEMENRRQNGKLKTIDNVFIPNRSSASGDTRLSDITRRRDEILLNPETTTGRWRSVQRSFSSEESPSDILEAFVRAEREKRRERRRKERQIVTSRSVFKPLLFWK